MRLLTKQLAAGLRNKRYTAVSRILDASNDASVAALVREVETGFEKIDVLHQNVALLRNAAIVDYPGEVFNADFAVNIGRARLQRKRVKQCNRNTAWSRQIRFDMICEANISNAGLSS